jgi:phage terminase small subunit
MTEKPLTEFEDLFCLEFTKDLNGTQSYLRAKGPEWKGKRTTAGAECHKLLKKPEVVRKIRTLMEKRAERVQVDSDDVLRELKHLGHSDLRRIYKADGTIMHPHEWPDDIARAIASIEVEELFEGHGDDRTWIGYTKKVKLWPKDKGLELMGKHKKLFTEKHEHSGTVSLEQLVAGEAKEKE